MAAYTKYWLRCAEGDTADPSPRSVEDDDEWSVPIRPYLSSTRLFPLSSPSVAFQGLLFSEMEWAKQGLREDTNEKKQDSFPPN